MVNSRGHTLEIPRTLNNLVTPDNPWNVTQDNCNPVILFVKDVMCFSK